MTPPSLYTINNQLFRDRPYAFKTSGSGAEPQIDGYATICCCTHENSRWALILNIILGCAAMIPTFTPTPEQEKSLETIKEMYGMAKNDLYKKTLSWVARTYNSANNVIQLKDPENGQIICKGLGSAAMDLGIQRHFRYTMIIDVKDGKIRVRYENINSENVGNVAGPNMNMQWNYVEGHLRALTGDLFNSIKDAEKEKEW